MPIFSDIYLWNDSTPGTGAENMAVDQLLLESLDGLPFLRFYSWSEPSVSFGYFETLAEAKLSFPETDGALQYIRRWTGGGIVDHRIDLTYTLAIPREHPLSKLRGAESYRIIHEAVAGALNAVGVKCDLTSHDSGNAISACFENPVAYDIVTPKGEKLAGAGQKRTRYGLLHQGSVVGISERELGREQWQQTFTSLVTEKAQLWQPEPTWLQKAQNIAQERYATQKWLEKR